MGRAGREPAIGFFVHYASVYHLPPWAGSARLWRRRGWRVHVFQLADAAGRAHSAFDDPGIVVHELAGALPLRLLLSVLDRAFRIFRPLGLRGLAGFGRELAFAASSGYFLLRALVAGRRVRLDALVGGDPPGLAAAWLLSGRGRRRALAYWCLEIWAMRDLGGMPVRRLWKRIERRASRDAAVTVDFGEERCRVLRDENGLPEGATLSVPNAPLGGAEPRRGDYFNRGLGVPSGKKIVLYAGGLGGFNAVREIVERMTGWPEEAVLVIHSREDAPRTRREMGRLAAGREGRVYVDMDPVGIGQLGELYASCDVGLQMWRPEDTNLATPGLSSGKVFWCLRAGKPLVVRRLPGYEAFFEGQGAGLCVDDEGGVGPALARILADEEGYRERAVAAYERHRFEPAHARLESLLGSALEK